MTDSIAWVGRHDREELQWVWNELCLAGTCIRFPSLAALRQTQPVKMLVVAMSRPGEFSMAEIAEIQAVWHDSQLVCLLGEWCCGQKRVNPGLANIPHLYVHQLQRRGVVEQLYACGPAEQTQPATPSKDLMLAVYARSTSYQISLADSLTPYFKNCLQLQFDNRNVSRGVDVVVWEANLNRDERMAELDQLSRLHPRARVVALITFPRTFEFREFRDRGVSVVAQPLSIAELVTAIRADVTAECSAGGLKMIA